MEYSGVWLDQFPRRATMRTSMTNRSGFVSVNARNPVSAVSPRPNETLPFEVASAGNLAEFGKAGGLTVLRRRRRPDLAAGN